MSIDRFTILFFPLIYNIENMKNQKLIKIILVLQLVFFVHQLKAQQDAQYTQYMYNTISINPAYAGTRGVFSAMALHRSQWVGIDNAPRTQTLTLNTPIGEENKMGLGVSVVNDRIGPTQESFFGIDFSYTIPTSAEGKISFGVKAGAHLLNVDLQGLDIINANDNLFENGIDNRLNPQFGFGAYYHTNNIYLGLSIPNTLENNHFDESSLSSNSNAVNFLAKERMNYYLISGYVFDLGILRQVETCYFGKDDRWSSVTT